MTAAELLSAAAARIDGPACRAWAEDPANAALLLPLAEAALTNGKDPGYLAAWILAVWLG